VPVGVVELKPVDRVSITTLVDNNLDVLMPDSGLVRRWGPVGTAGPVPVIPAELAEGGKSADFVKAEHGYSALVEIEIGGRKHRILFDAGVSPDGLVDNLDRLAISPETFEGIVLSHGHFDHVMGLEGLARRLGTRNLPVMIHPEFWTRRRVVSPSGEWELPVPSRSGMEDSGFSIVEARQPSILFEGALLITGEVDRTSGFEQGMSIHQAWREDGWQPDPLILDDQALLVEVAGKGLVVLTGCGHSGIINIIRYAKKLTGLGRLYAVIGGFHLTGGLFEPIIPQTIAALKAEQPQVVIPAHCTGWRATSQLAMELPEAFIPNSVGSRYEL
jgi:7,8-dihydropterin-6-yl-methyl-4-(beta-D-ribofuranosyl)aminobenzene 5'-phosphate synthase